MNANRVIKVTAAIYIVGGIYVYLRDKSAIAAFMWPVLLVNKLRR